ncbi:hypothetical protein CyaNS01_01732 [Cyanobium sp. NS01]|nr:hypothetical protein CyaNS01_01732 [Cyanobium sp. NS01]
MGAEFIAFFPLHCAASVLRDFKGSFLWPLFAFFQWRGLRPAGGQRMSKNRKNAPRPNWLRPLAPEGNTKNRTNLVYHVRVW